MSSACGVDDVTSLNDFGLTFEPREASTASLRMNAAMSWRFTESMPRYVREPSDSFQPVVMPAWASHRTSSACGVDDVTSRNAFQSAEAGFHVVASVTFMRFASRRRNAAMSWRFTVSMPRYVRDPSGSSQPVLMPAEAVHSMSSACGVDDVTSLNVASPAYADGPAMPAASVAIAASPAARRFANILFLPSIGIPPCLPGRDGLILRASLVSIILYERGHGGVGGPAMSMPFVGVDTGS